ncbi:hypothetical protein O6H91_13G086200 [Diphasiastrum complanatum]|uniref:Uncharacterized protein n=1 Tax=Diphasiastrum complanatum TaxID=34168 RepID=A0ACC2BX19_DIPCM|nr:hypothetical protein O6H91_13G086200 [Diphasiastrum complanatum]
MCSNPQSGRLLRNLRGYFSNFSKAVKQPKLYPFAGLTRKERLKYLLHELDEEAFEGDVETYGYLVRECCDLKALSEGKQLHAHIVRKRLGNDRFLANLLISMYGKCGSLETAREVFDKIYEPNVFSWTAMIGACTEHAFGSEALQLFRQMQNEGVKPDKVTLVTVLNACANSENLADGKFIHSCIVDSGLQLDVRVGTALANMYGRCGSLDDAKEIFDRIPERDLVGWNAMIAAHAQHGHLAGAVQVFRQMRRQGITPNRNTFISMLNACSSPTALKEGKFIHSFLQSSKLLSDVPVATALLNMYSKCGRLEDSRMVFDSMPERDEIAWNTMISAYARQGFGTEALDLYREMRQAGMRLGKVTFVSILDACTAPAALADGIAIHADIIELGFERDVVVETSLTNMYGNCGSLEDARKTFDYMAARNSVSWNAIIGAYASSGSGNEALQLFQQMQLEGEKPDRITIISILEACANLKSLVEGAWIHAYILGTKFETDVTVETALVDMYAKCGSLEDACRVFNRMSERSIVSWNAMIGTHSQHGIYERALQLFGQMQHESVKADEIAFVGVLSACSHAGLVDAGSHYFDCIGKSHFVTPTLEHYGCMVDLLGRAGQLDEAEDLVREMPFEPDAVVWMTLLGACRVHGDVERGRRVAENLFELDPWKDAAYAVLSNMYAAAGRWHDVAEVRQMMNYRRVKEEQGISSI